MATQVVGGFKQCNICAEVKPLDDFYFSKGYPQAYCKGCQNAYAKRWRTENSEYYKEFKKERYKLLTKEDRQHNKLFTRYGITLETYNKMVADQKGVCKICGMVCRRRKRLSVDHCHNTKIVRGLLCDDCNNLIARAKDSPEILKKAAEYLEGVWIPKR